MIHFSCDMCGKDLSNNKDAQRFIVKISAYASGECDQLKEDDFDEDHLESVADLIRQQAEEDAQEDPTQSRGFRYDLCTACHRRFVEDPLNRDPLRLLNFSKN